MCKFTYLGYDRCDEPDRHYLIRREKCGAKAHLKHWCAPHEQEEAATANQQGKFWVSLPCPMCADTPVVYDQPLLEIAHSRRSVLPAPHYDAVSRKYSRLPKHQTPADDLPENVIPRPLKTSRMQVRRAATESAVHKAGSPARGDQQEYTLPATTYIPPPQELKLPKPLPIPQPLTLTPPSSREGSRSPPQISMDGALRTTPPGEGNRRELEHIRMKSRAGAASSAPREQRPATPERSRSGSASSSTSSANDGSQGSRPSRQASSASTTTTASSSQSSRATATGSSYRHRPHWYATPSRSAQQQQQQQQQQQDSVADTITAAALRSIGIGRSLSRSASPSSSSSPERGRRPRRRPTGGSSSERSDSPSVWRPTISPPVLQNDSLGIGPVTNDVEPFRQRLVPFPPRPPAAVPPGSGGSGDGDNSQTPNGASVAAGEGLVEEPPRPRTPHPHPQGGGGGGGNRPPATVLRLFPNAADDEEVAAAAFERMFAAEARAQAYQVRVQAQAQADAQAQVETQIRARAAGTSREEGPGGGGGGGGAAAASSSSGGQGGHGGRDNKAFLPPVPGPFRRILSGQVRTVNVPPPRPLRRQNTTDGVMAPAAASSSSKPSSSPPPQPGGSVVRVKPGPTFSLAGVVGGGGGGGGRAQEFEIVTGPDGSILQEPALGQAF